MRPFLFLLTALLMLGASGRGRCDGAAGSERAGEAGKALPESLKLKTSHKKDGENNPLYTQRFGADPGVMEYGGRLYVYMTQDIVERGADDSVKENSYAQIRSLSCISSEDLVNWTDHGMIHVAGSYGAAPWAANSWAPCAAHKVIGGKETFFLYFCNGGNGIGVLTAESPTGPWKDPLGRPLISRATPECADVVWLFDPAVMVDDDGTGYLAFGGGVPEGKAANPGTARIVRLAEDMIHPDGDPVRLDAPWLFEDSGINKINGKYIYSYCSNWQTEGNSLKLTSGAIQYMTADSPLGPYTYAGELFPNEGRFFGLWGNNHHSIAEMNGKYYLFYHSRPVEKAMGISGNYRSPQADEIRMREDGMPLQAVGTMEGLKQLKPLDPYRTVSARTMSAQAGVRYSQGLISGTAGSWIRISGADFGKGARSVTVRAAFPDGGKLYLIPDSLHGSVSAVISPAEPTDETAEITVPFEAAGVHDIYFVFGGNILFDSWQAGKE